VFIKSFGLFWRTDEVDWHPGKGSAFRLLGRRGQNLPSRRLADFRDQQGIYILYGNHGPHYVGLTKRLGLGNRLKQHLENRHAEQWDRFSWFGFRKVLLRRDSNGICELARMAEMAGGSPDAVITDVEALLIRAMGLSNNINQMRFTAADEWTQIKSHELEHYLGEPK
jgi:hypothetical protein